MIQKLTAYLIDNDCVPTPFAAMRSPLKIGDGESLPKPNVLASLRAIGVATRSTFCRLFWSRSHVEFGSASERSEVERGALNEPGECVLSARLRSAKC